MPKKPVHVRPYERVKHGKLERVAYETEGYWKKIEAIDKKLFDHLGEVRNLNIERYIEMHPEAMKVVPTFMWPNEYSRKHPDKCKVLGIDVDEAPEVEDVPEFGIPGSIVMHKNTNYVAGEDGKFQKLPDPRDASLIIEYGDLNRRERKVLPLVVRDLTTAQHTVGLELVYRGGKGPTSKIGSPSILKKLEQKGLVSKEIVKSKYIWNLTPMGKYIWKDEIEEYIFEQAEEKAKSKK